VLLPVAQRWGDGRQAHLCLIDRLRWRSSEDGMKLPTGPGCPTTCWSGSPKPEIVTKSRRDRVWLEHHQQTAPARIEWE